MPARTTDAVDGCYLLHFERPIYGAQHYLGWSVDIRRRVRFHLNGRGARLVRQALRAGIGVQLVRVWPTVARKHEYVLKRQTPKRHCPRCQRIAALEGETVLAGLLSAEAKVVRRGQGRARRPTMAQ